MKKKAIALILFGMFFLLPLALSLVSAPASTTGPSCQQTGTEQEGWYENDQLIMNISCSGCKSACLYGGTENEGWYNSCDQSLIKYGACYIACYGDDKSRTEHKSYCKDSQACEEIINYICENPGTASSKYVGSTTAACAVCAYGCSDGFCKTQEPTQICKDSDGEDYYTKGYVKTQTGEIWDSCSGDSQVYEGLCTDGSYKNTIYTCPEICKDGACAKKETWTGGLYIEPVESICEPCVSTTKETPCRCESIKVNNAKVQLYDSSGNLLGSADASTGMVGFSGLTEGRYAASISADGYNSYKLQVSLGPNIGNHYTVNLVKIGITTEPSQPTVSSGQIPSVYWYMNAYWQCYDGYEEYSGGETSCKPRDVWKNYADDSCKQHCSSETGKCGINQLKVYNECAGSSNVQQSVCGNGICESAEGETCEVTAVSCEIGKKCESTQSAKCYYGCEQDCKQTEEKYVNARLNEKFKLQMSQYAKFEDISLEIKFNDFFLPACIQPAASTSTQQSASAVMEKYSPVTGAVIARMTGMPTSSSGGGGGGGGTASSAGGGGGATQSVSTECKETEPYAVLQIKLVEEPNNQRTEVIKLRMGEKKKVLGLTISFMDNDIQGKTGLFLVSKDDFECPENCRCDLSGNTTECKKIKACEKGTMLCQDGVCRDKCGIKNITTECNFGCFYNGKCLPYGLRVNKLYCSIDDNMKSQLAEDELCDNNFECQTNVCVNGKCMSAGLIQMIIDWFKKLFGGQ